MERRDYRTLSDPDMGYQRKAADRITALADGRGFAITVQPGDTGVAMAQTNSGIRAEVTAKGERSGIREGTRTIWTTRFTGRGPQPTGGWGSKAQGHGPNGTGQATLFLTTLDGFWDQRLWAADTQRRFDQFRVVDAKGMPLRYEDGEEVLVVEEIIASVDPKVGSYRMNANGVDQGQANFATLHARRVDGSTIAAADRWMAPKRGQYTNDRSRAWSVEVRDFARFAGDDATIATVLAALGHGPSIPPAEPPTLPGSCAAELVRIAGLEAALAGARGEADSLALARDAALAAAAAKQRRLSAVISAAMDDPDDPGD